MAIQNEPSRISTPFADAGTKNVIPETMSQPSATAAASWQAGFPTVCSLPLSAGGIPPARNDFNGLLNQMTQTERFLQDGGIFSCDVKLIKPDRAIFSLFLDRFSLDPGECLFIDDRQDNCDAASSLGMKSYCFSSYEEDRPAIMKLVDPDSSRP